MRYLFDVACPRCGGPVEHVASGTGGRSTSAVTTCATCRSDWLVTTTILAISAPNNLPPGGGQAPARCGTESGHLAHRRRGELPCGDCMEAVRVAKRERRRRSRTPAVIV